MRGKFLFTIKMEGVFCRSYKSSEKAKNRIFDYITIFKNSKRRYSFLEYVSPEVSKSRVACSQNAA